MAQYHSLCRYSSSVVASLRSKIIDNTLDAVDGGDGVLTAFAGVEKGILW